MTLRPRVRLHAWLLFGPTLLISSCDSTGAVLSGDECAAGECPAGPVGGAASPGETQEPSSEGATAAWQPDGGTSAPVGSGLPCDVQAVVASRCAATCHSDPPVGTYMPLVNHANFHAPAATDASRAVWELAIERIHSEPNPMPPVTAPALSDSERETLDTWLRAGAPESDADCGEQTAGAEGITPPGEAEIDVEGLECYKLLAHAPGDKAQKFEVGQATDAYYNMYFDAPWEGTVYGIVLRPVIDNAQVLHHWLLYSDPSTGRDGDITDSSGRHSEGNLISGWAPGGIAINFRAIEDDVGMELPDQTYLLELHYNSADAGARDASGVEVCVQREPPANIAGMSWLGYDHGVETAAIGEIFGTQQQVSCAFPSDEWQGTCDPGHDESIHLVYMTPHMHEAGVHMRATIEGPNGSRPLHDEPFDFNYQTTYPTSEVLMPGERIVTTCNFSKPSCLGQSTDMEMCYLFTYAYPQHALADNGVWGSIAHGEDACLGQ